MKLIVIEQTELSELIENTVRRVISAASPKPIAKAPKDTLSIDDLVDITGYKKNTLYRLVHDRKIPFRKPMHGGRKLVFIRTEIEDWMKGRKPQSTDEYINQMEENLFLKHRRK
ncbi:helix-turn-helix transcriptional regulator [Carboxylicivirga linearis]|uniref:Helix-turn-helix domain-containing protein n=1 Tax=Carboxylicivirga linearis TaxID=1628157 RepID=A0ABS5JYK4_9BACT|nr:helix-turn-helix domain-containing protein [Carboxylicivirga linearis]MBS2099943.1 helix-turn-helix domain-containing protein [Carboxylicivirga linearis]